MDEKNVKDALDSFERDDFISAKEILSTEIKKSKYDYLKNKLGLTKDIEDEKIRK